ncbi:MAG: cold-shock DNA-binding domain protein [Frankiales bacterium]|nr:cold-shock DNA-binding domain protein [Frankiales bacterium]
MPQGSVRWFDPERGFGFLAPEDGSADLFVHVSEIVADSGGTRLLREGQAVEFEVGQGDRGPQARGVRVTGDMAAGAALGVLGTVKWYEPAKGYGFATPDGGTSEVFLHSSAIVTGGVVTAGQRVAFLVGEGEGEHGPQAEHVVPLGAAAVQDAADDGADGTVSWYDEGKGFGFIAPDDGGQDVFVQVRALADGLTWLEEGDRVVYEVVQGDKGPQARDLQLVRGAGTTAAPAAAAATAHPKGRSAPARPGEGVVARYDAERGFGFITPDAGGADLFVHMSVLVDAEPLQKGERVRYGIRQSDRGPQADRVERA